MGFVSMTHHRHNQSLRSENDDPREVELKLAVPDDSVHGLSKHLKALPSAVGRPHRRHEVTTYFDTPDQALRRSGMSLRIRRIDARRIQTLKANGRAGVAADRAEWEWPVEQDDPDISLLAQAPMAGNLPPAQALTPIFTTDIHRTVLALELEGGTVVEAAFDDGVIKTDNARLPIRELELELRKGDAAPLYRLALQLNAAIPLTVESESKAARGYRLKAGVDPEVHKADNVPLRKQTTAAEAFQQILRACLGHLLVNQPAALAGDAEGVHQMRVAIRRLRATLTLFQPHLEPHTASLFQSELRRVGRVFGEARDWDVFCLEILPEALEAAHAAGWRDLVPQPATDARQAAHRHFVAEVSGSAFTALVLGLAAWTEDRGLLGDPALARPIVKLSPDLLDRLARKVERRGRHIESSDAERHAVRKSLKKLRYCIDFLRPVFPPKPVKSFLRGCKKLQQSLGDINDTVTATALADQLVDRSRPDLAPAAGALATELAQRRDEALRGLAKRWKEFRAEPHFWA